jgi:peptide/nickel transport system substrate-binding protein
MFLTSWIFDDLYSPAVNQAIDGSWERGWFGWYCSEAMERLRTEWARAEDSDKRNALLEEIQRMAYDEVPYVPLGQWTQRRAYRSHVKGVVPFAAPVLWNVRLDKK